MLNSFEQISAKPGLKHCFFIPCDSHGPQLLIKDIMQYPAYSDIIKAAAQLIEHLHHADKQYQIFKEIQEKFSGKHHVLMKPADTR
jgi:hypothetical protein